MSLLLFQNKSKNNRSPALAFVFVNKQPKSCLCTNEKLFFSLYFSFTRKQAPNRQFFLLFVNKTISKWETETKQKKKLNWFFCFFGRFFIPFATTGKRKKTLLQKWGDHSDDNKYGLFEIRKTFLNLHCWFFWAETVWNQKGRKSNFFSTLFPAEDTLCTSDKLLPNPLPPKKGHLLGGYVFLDFFYEFLRLGQKILHNNSTELIGSFCWILAVRMPFPATNFVLNFIFLQKFLQFCSFLDIFFSKCQKVTKSPQSI